MVNKTTLGIGLICAFAVLPARSADLGHGGTICVYNDDDRRLLFVAEAGERDRIIGYLSRGEKLCQPTDRQSGVVRVFVNESSIEGCSRLAQTGEPQRLQAYAGFDNCRWQN